LVPIMLVLTSSPLAIVRGTTKGARISSCSQGQYMYLVFLCISSQHSRGCHTPNPPSRRHARLDRDPRSMQGTATVLARRSNRSTHRGVPGRICWWARSSGIWPKSGTLASSRLQSVKRPVPPRSWAGTNTFYRPDFARAILVKTPPWIVSP